MKKQPAVYSGSSGFNETNRDVKDFLKSHKGTLNVEERNTLGDLLDRRAAAISDFLGVKVSSVVDHKK